MPLPKLEKPIFTATFPGSNTKFSYRPFDSKEQKSILISVQGGNETEVYRNLVNLLNACTFEKYDFMHRKISDFEMAFLAIRSKSVGEMIEVNYKCTKHVKEADKKNPDVIIDKECGHRNSVDIYFIDELNHTPEPNPIIELTDSIKLKLKPTTMYDIINNVDIDDDDVLYGKVECISEGDEIFNDFSREEFKEFMQNVPVAARNAIVEYYNSQSLSFVTKKTKCKKCGNESEFEIKGALNFFV